MTTVPLTDIETKTITGSFTRIVSKVRKKPISTIALQLFGDLSLQNLFVWELDLMDDMDFSPFIVRFVSDDSIFSGEVHVGCIVYFREIQFIHCTIRHQQVQIRFIPRVIVIDESSSLLTKRRFSDIISSSSKEPSGTNSPCSLSIASNHVLSPATL